MSLTVKNIGCIQAAGAAGKGKKDTKSPDSTFGEVGTVRVVFQGLEYVFGPNCSITFADNGIGTAVAAADSRLRICDTRDGFDKGTSVK